MSVTTKITQTGTMNGDRSRGTAEEGVDSKSKLPLEIVFRALANRRRRTILYYLTERMRPVPLEELVNQIAAQESETHEADISAEVYERVALDLYHTQLPKLVEWGIVEHEEDLNLITVAETLRPLDEYLRLAEQHDRRQMETPDRT